jgi:hypothetical protein
MCQRQRRRTAARPASPTPITASVADIHARRHSRTSISKVDRSTNRTSAAPAGSGIVSGTCSGVNDALASTLPVGWPPTVVRNSLALHGHGDANWRRGTMVTGKPAPIWKKADPVGRLTECSSDRKLLPVYEDSDGQITIFQFRARGGANADPIGCLFREQGESQQRMCPVYRIFGCTEAKSWEKGGLLTPHKDIPHTCGPHKVRTEGPFGYMLVDSRTDCTKLAAQES